MTGPSCPEPAPASSGKWRIAMRWEELLFVHWPVPASSLARRLPPGLEPETLDSTAWLGLVPFRMRDTRPVGFPGFPGATTFPELNVRTYVRHRDRSGVWFFSLDAASRMAVWAARKFFHLEYFHAAMAISRTGEAVQYRSRRTGGGDVVQFQARYRGTGTGTHSVPGSLEHWLTERYRLFSADRSGRIWTAAIRHPPWSLRPAEVEIESNSMASPLGIRLDGPPPHVRLASPVDVLATGIQPADAPAGTDRG